MYSKLDHKKAFIIWMNGKSKRRLGKMEQFPSRRQIIEWSKDSYSCQCPFHGWDELKRDILRGEDDLEDEDVNQFRSSNSPTDFEDNPIFDEEQEVQFAKLSMEDKLNALEQIGFEAIFERGLIPDNFNDAMQLLNLVYRYRPEYAGDILDIEEEETIRVEMEKTAKGTKNEDD